MVVLVWNCSKVYEANKMNNRAIWIFIAIIMGLYIMAKHVVNSLTSSVLDRLAMAIQHHEGWYVGSRSYQNNNPGNIKYVGQALAVGQDEAGFCVFATYEDGYSELLRELGLAFSGQYGYSSTMSLYEFFAVYSPDGSSNSYAEDVATQMGVSPDTELINL